MPACRHAHEADVAGIATASHMSDSTPTTLTEIYRARWILPVCASPIPHGELVVRAGRIVAVRPAQRQHHTAEKRAGDVRVHELGDVLLLPGFVNAHAHLELTCYRGQLEPAPLFDWFDRLAPLRMTPGAESREREETRAGADESLAAGVTCIGDTSRTGASVAVLADHPIRKVCFVELISGGYRSPCDVPTLTAALDELQNHERPDRLQIGVSPHSPYTVTIDDLQNVSRLSAARKLRMSMHALETRAEADWIETGGGPIAEFAAAKGLSTGRQRFGGGFMSSLSAWGLLNERMLLAHVNYASDAELAALSGTQASVAWCPRAHAWFGHEAHQFRDMLAAGVNVCIGTDSAASNHSLSILDEMRHVAIAHPDVSPDRILEMGTIRSAAGLGLASLIGSLAPGKMADFIAVGYDPAWDRGPAEFLLRSAESVSCVWLEGARMTRTVAT